MPNTYPLSFLELAGRLLLAMLLGAMIGWERERASKPAGLRTNILVSLGSATFALSLLQSQTGQESVDSLSRVVQGISTGVGFVGAGSILKGDRTHGLTSAATVWISAAIGLGVSVGQWQMGILVTVLTLFTLHVLKHVERTRDN
ncbi:MgtC/SapB family protein [Leptolyngbya sp. FACHB-16]|nr:MgtC/SapB family protein [Leptolyngbya sp. FACHB-8]MBD2156883.1 MgtC/SapB family protein [Leptolyngbya sp. FACHB-16]